MALPPGFIDELRGRVSLARVVGRRVTWDPRKSNAAKGDFWAPCPFHQEKSPSFHVDDRKGFYYCFGCQAKGDAVSFLRESESLGFLEAVERLAGEAGMAMPAADPAAAAKTVVANGLVAVMEAAVRFYRAQLNGAGAAAARAYLDGRGVDQGARATFEIGFAGSARAALFDHLRNKGVPASEIEAVGLCVADDGGPPRDRFRDRIIFPIRDARGRAIAFGGRAMSPEARAKYLNSPETTLFDKGRTLYNFGPARAAAARSGALVVVEGYMDVIALAQAGLGHVVAPLGTAITADQLGLMWRVADEPVIALDGDKAGRGAANRLVDLALPLLAAGKGLRFAVLPAGQDPDDVVRAGGLAAVAGLIERSRPMIDLLWERETEGAALDSPERRAALDARLRGHVGRIGDPGIRAHYQAEIRARCAAVFAPPRRPRERRGWPPAAASALPATRASLLARTVEGAATGARIRESAILAGCIAHPDLAARFEDRLERAGFHCRDLALVRDALLAALGRDAVDLRAAVTAALGRDPLPELLSLGPLRANPRLGAGADAAFAARAVDEALERQEAWIGRRAEVRDAERDLMGDADEGVTWRLREAAEAAEAAAARPFADAERESDDESELSLALQNLLDDQISIKPQR